MKEATILTREESVARGDVSVEISKVAVGAIGVTSVLIGCWAVVCIISGMVSSGGPFELVRSLFAAMGG